MTEFVLSTFSARRMLVWVLHFVIELASIPQSKVYVTTKAVSIATYLIMLILKCKYWAHFD